MKRLVAFAILEAELTAVESSRKSIRNYAIGLWLCATLASASGLLLLGGNLSLWSHAYAVATLFFTPVLSLFCVLSILLRVWIIKHIVKSIKDDSEKPCGRCGAIHQPHMNTLCPL